LRAKVYFRVLHIIWLVSFFTLLLYFMSHPYSTLYNKADAAVLLTLHPLVHCASIACVLEISHQLIRHVLTVTATMSSYFGPASTAAEQGHGPQDERNQQHAQQHQRLLKIIRWTFVPTNVSIAVILLVFMTLLPNAYGVDTTDPVSLEFTMRFAWLCIMFSAFVNPIVLVYITLKVRRMVHESVIFQNRLSDQRQQAQQRQAQQQQQQQHLEVPNSGAAQPPSHDEHESLSSKTSESGTSSKPKDHSNSNNTPNGTNKNSHGYSHKKDSKGSEKIKARNQMVLLEQRLTRAVIFQVIGLVFNSALYAMAVAEGMQYWYKKVCLP